MVRVSILARLNGRALQPFFQRKRITPKFQSSPGLMAGRYTEEAQLWECLILSFNPRPA